jgi:glycosyltransferase involved in cell wall biosynthesis
MKKMQIELWGGYPPPIGGVTIHTFRLIHNLNRLDDEIKLRNFGESKPDYPYIINIKYTLLNVFALLFCKRKIIHLQSNNFLFFLSLLLFGFRHKIGVTIHNKNLINEFLPIKKYIIKSFFKKNCFVILNDAKYKGALASKFEISNNKLFLLPAFIPPLDIEIKGLSDDILRFRNKHAFIISANAFKLRLEAGIDVYGLDLLINLVNELKNKNIDIGLLFCLPMIGDECYYKQCLLTIKQLELSDRIMILQRIIPNGFEVWKISDLFIRPTLTDIEGLSVKEALHYKTPVIASDVCDRPKGAILFRNRDFDDLLEKTLSFINNKDNFKIETDIVENTVSKIYNIYQKLL